MSGTIQRRPFLTRILRRSLGAPTAAVIGVPVLGFLISPLIRKAPRGAGASSGRLTASRWAKR